MNRERFKKGQIIYSQGCWKCKCIFDDGYSVSYIALEGYESSYKGTLLSATRRLFSPKRDKGWGKNTKNNLIKK